MYNFSEYQLLEQLDLSKKDCAILFTDIVNSSILWKDDEKEMINALDQHFNTINQIVSKNSGFIVKEIGDSFMCNFEKLINSIECAYEIQKDLQENPLEIKDKLIKLRIGICYGDILEKETIIQNQKLLDYFGNTVNSSSRMESKVSNPDGFAFSFTNNVDESEIENFLKNKCEIESIDFINIEDPQIKRSGRLLTDTHRHISKSIEELKGVKEIRAYKCTILS